MQGSYTYVIIPFDHVGLFKKMKIVFELISWLFGLLSLLASITIYPDSVPGAVVFLLIGLLLFPPFRKLVYIFTRKELKTDARAVSILLLLITLGFIIVQDAKIKTQNNKESIATTNSSM